jgi:pyrroline-5-carboxylate reductase
LKNSSGVHKAGSLAELAQKCSIIFLAVKPQNFAEVLTDLKANPSGL